MSNRDVEAYPLHWPVGVPRTTHPLRSAFKVSTGAARQSLSDELHLLDATQTVISSNLGLRLDGLPYANQKRPDDCGVAVYFKLAGKDMCIAVDKFDDPYDNMRAIALSIGALRGLERWGGGEMVNAAFTGFQALPNPEQHWSSILGVSPNATADEIKAAWKARMKDLGSTDHPDAMRINVAKDRAMQERTPHDPL